MPFGPDHGFKRRSNKDPGKRITYALTAFCVAVSLVIATLFVGDLRTGYNTRINDAKRNGENFAEVLAEHTARSFETVQRAMREAESIRDQLSRKRLTADEAHSALMSLQRTSPVLVALAWTDAQGNLEAHSYEGAPPRPNLADLPYFIAHRDHPGLGLVIAKPFRSIATGQWITDASLRLDNADGSFAGIVSAPINQAYFANIYQAIKPGEHGSVFLIDRDGEVLIRQPFVDGAIGKSFASAELFRKYLPRAESGSFEGTSLLDGTSRIYGYKTVPGLPLVVVVTYERADVLQLWYRRTRTLGAMVAMLVAGLLLSATLLWRRTRALSVQSAFTKGIIEHMDQGLVLVDRDGRVAVANDRAKALLELPEGFLDSRPRAEEVRALLADGGEYAALSSPEDKYRRNIAALRRSELVVYERTRPNGACIEVRMAPMPDGGVVLTYTDITARKAFERALREDEERFRGLLEAAPDAMVIVDADGRIAIVNTQAEKLFGYERAALIGQPVEMLMPQRFRGDHRGHRAGYASDPRSRAMGSGLDLLGCRKDGTEFPIEISLSPIEVNGQAFVSSAIRDVTARKRMEGALRESEERFRIMTANVPGVVFRRVQTLDGRVSFSFVSAGIAELCGLTPEAVMADSSLLYEAVHPDDREIVLENARQSARDLAPIRNEVRFVAQGGATKWVQTLAQPQRAANGDIVWDGVIIDVTALKEAEAAAEAANRAKTEFLASMSHELRTPLTSILGFADLLLDQNMTPEQRRYLELQRDAGRILLAVVNDILDFSKIEAGALTLEAVPLSIASIVDSCRNILAAAAKAKNIDLLVSVDADVPDGVIGDPVRLRQILHNLLSNAIKFTAKGRIELTVRRLPADNPGQCSLQFEIKDTGIGIPPEKLDRLFQRFSQVDSSTARQYGGTGLGLAICRRLVEAMGGKIGVNSVLGVGSAFWFAVSLPIASKGANAALEESAAAYAPAAPRRILLAEDVEPNQLLIGSMLRAAGHQVDIVGDGAAAVDAARSGGYDVILMDMQMPRMDGLAATRLIRARERSDEHIPIIALTANVMSNEVRRCVEAGMDAHASKPIDRPALLRLIDELAASHTQGRSVVRGSFRPAFGRECGRDAVNVDVLQELERVLGYGRLVQLLTIFDRGLSMRSGLFDKPEGVSMSQLREVGHALVGMAGNLGFIRLSDEARHLMEIDANTPAVEVSARIAALRAAALQVGEILPYFLEAESIAAALEMLSAQGAAVTSKQRSEAGGTTTGVA